MDINEEKDLILHIKQGDIQAFEILITKYENQIYTLCKRMLLDEGMAEDAVQEICVKIWKEISRFEEKAKFSTWVYRISVNQCIDIIRKNKRKNETSLVKENRIENEQWQMEIEDQEGNIEEKMESYELKKILEEALLQLKPQYRVICVLRDINDYSYEEIANILGISIGTVKSRISRARQALKKILLQSKEPYKSFFRQMTRREGTHNEM